MTAAEQREPSSVGDFASGAVIDHTERFRYQLWRTWDPNKERLLWVMLNPSTADHTNNDPTIRKCIGFAKLWGYGSIEVVNLFALRSREPRNLVTTSDRIGEWNDTAISRAVARAGCVVAAWGAPSWPFVSSRALEVEAELPGTVYCLGRTNHGHPKHPLFPAYATPPESFRRLAP